MRLISLNIETDFHYDLIFPFFEKENADIICLQEVLEDDFLVIKERLGMEGVYKAFMYENSNLEHYKNKHGKKQGNAIFAKNILHSGYCFYWGREENVSIVFDEYNKDENLQKNYVVVHVSMLGEDGQVYTIANTHFPVTVRGESTPHQLEIVEPLSKYLDSLQGVVLVGDFNAPRGNATFTKIVEKYKDNIPKHYTTSLDQNLHRVKGLQFMVDGLFTTPEYSASDVKLVDGVSDHMAIVATITKTRQ